MTQALAAGALDCATQAPLSLANGVVGGNLKAYIVAQHVFEKPGGFSVYWAVKEILRSRPLPISRIRPLGFR